ncbi:GNAT family N-acetyltransferase [candidate division KSB1 bacterium]|nr:GNAT family N-acetyltransferase [candidate division KSB1 bacterium]
MDLVIEPYSETKQTAWDDFVWKSNAGTIFHTRRFLSYHPPERFQDASLFFYRNHQILALFPATVRQDKNARILASHRGASYGGFVTQSPLSIQDAFRLVEGLLQYATQANFTGIELTIPPQIYARRPNNYLEFAFFRNGFNYRKREISSVIPLDFTASQILDTFIAASRRNVKRALKLGITVRETEDYAEFYDILKKNLKMRHNVTPTHTLEELLHLKSLFPARIKLFAAYGGTKMVAGVVMFTCNPQVVLAFYISHNEEYQQYRGVNILFYEIIKWAIENGYKFLDFGIFTVDMEPNWGLGRFKESFGAQGVFRDTLIKMFW